MAANSVSWARSSAAAGSRTKLCARLRTQPVCPRRRSMSIRRSIARGSLSAAAELLRQKRQKSTQPSHRRRTELKARQTEEWARTSREAVASSGRGLLSQLDLFCDPLHIIQHTQQVPAPEQPDFFFAVPAPNQLERHVERLRGVVPAIDTSATVEIRADSDVRSARSIRPCSRCGRRSQRRPGGRRCATTAGQRSSFMAASTACMRPSYASRSASLNARTRPPRRVARLRAHPPRAVRKRAKRPHDSPRSSPKRRSS